MAIDNQALPTEGTPQAVTALIGDKKTIHSARTYKHGSVTVLELEFSDSTTSFIKFSSNSGLEIGGTLEMGTGTSVTW
jgi:hypothetical protein